MKVRAPRSWPVRLAWILLGVTLARPAVATAAEEPASKRPNVLFLFTDDQRADTIHALGNPVIQTPNLDGLARAGFVFNNAYCMGGDQPAVCLPSRTMVLSGRSLFHLDRVNRESPNFPRSLREAGYVTYHHGKSGNTPHQIHKDFDHSHYVSNDNKERSSGHPGKEVADDAIAFLKGRPQDRPFFMYLAFGNPHDPRVVIDAYRNRYDEQAMPLPRNFLPLHPINNGELTIRDEALAPWPRTPEMIRQHLTDYYGVISYLDMEIGRILHTLKETGQYDDTIIIFSSDHGLAVGSHGLMGKQNLYEDGMKAPLIFQGPGIPQGHSDALVYLFDIYPTVCDLVGAPMPDGIDGKSLAPILHGETDAVRDTIFLAYRKVQRRAQRGLEADPLPPDQYDPTVQPERRPGRDEEPRRRPEARGPGRGDDGRAETTAKGVRRHAAADVRESRAGGDRRIVFPAHKPMTKTTDDRGCHRRGRASVIGRS